VGAPSAENKLHVALLPELKLGGATIRNVVLLVLDDNSLNVPMGKTMQFVPTSEMDFCFSYRSSSTNSFG